MKNWDESNDEEVNGDINVTPLVDTALVLLLVFMVAAPIIMNQAIKVKLPKVSNSKAAKVTTVAVTLKKDGTLYFNGKKTDYKNLRDQVTLMVEKARKRSPNPAKPKIQATIAADQSVSHGKVMHLVDIVKDCGVLEFAFNIQKVEKVPGP